MQRRHARINEHSSHTEIECNLLHLDVKHSAHNSGWERSFGRQIALLDTVAVVTEGKAEVRPKIPTNSVHIDTNTCSCYN